MVTPSSNHVPSTTSATAAGVVASHAFRGVSPRKSMSPVRSATRPAESRAAIAVTHRSPRVVMPRSSSRTASRGRPRGKCAEPARNVEDPGPALDSPNVALTIGIVGLPNAGKSTLFNALTKNDVLAANYPFATIEPNVGVVGVPDHRLGKLAEIFGSERQLPATVQFVDIAGIVRGASEGEGLGNKCLSHIRESDAICQVTRVFRDEDVTHVDGKVSPADDIETISTELILADLQTLENALPRLDKESRKDKSLVPAFEAAKEAQAVLEGGKGAFQAGLDLDAIRDLHLLSAKRQLFVFNCDTDELNDEDLKARMREIVAPAEAIFLDAKSEAELVELGDDEEAEA